VKRKPKPPLSPHAAVRALALARTRRENELRAVQFKHLCLQEGLPMPVREIVFDETGERRFRWDFCWVEEKIAIEQRLNSRYIVSEDKLKLGSQQGWAVLVTDDILSPETQRWVAMCLQASARVAIPEDANSSQGDYANTAEVGSTQRRH